MEKAKIVFLRITTIFLALLWILGIVVAGIFEGSSTLLPILLGSAHIGGPIVAFFLAEALGSEGFSWAIGAFFFPVIVLPILAFKKRWRYEPTPRKTQPSTLYVRQPSAGSVQVSSHPQIVQELELKSGTPTVATDTSRPLEVLLQLCDAYAENDKDRIARLEPLATQIGEDLNRRGGLKEMRRMFDQLGGRRGSRTLEMHWSGIGDWRI